MTEGDLEEGLAALLDAGMVVRLPAPLADGTDTVLTDTGRAALAMLAFIAGVDEKLDELMHLIHATEKPKGVLTH